MRTHQDFVYKYFAKIFSLNKTRVYATERWELE